MKNIFSLSKLVAVAAFALTLGSCSRSEYAMLPQGSSYLGSTRVATPVPAAAPKAAPVAAASPVAEVAPVAAPVAVAAAPAAPVAKSETAVAPVAAPAAKKLSDATVAAAPAPKLNIVQRAMLSKVVRKMDKLAQKSVIMQKHGDTAATQKLDTRLRQAILFWILGVVLEIVGALTIWPIAVAGYVLIVVGTVFFIIWLVEKFSK